MKARVVRRPLLAVILALGGASAWAVVPRSTPVERRIASPRGFQTTVATRGGDATPESRTETDQLRVIVRASGDPLILLPEGLGASLAALRDHRLAALDRLADDVVRVDNEVRKARGKAPRTSADVVARRFTHVFHGLAASVHHETLERLRKLPGVTGVWVDQRISAMLANSVPLIRADQVWNQLGYRGAGVTVAVLDTGIDYHRPDLGGCFGAGCKVERGHDFIHNDADPMDDHGHGTHVAGIVAANGTVVGVAPQAKLWAYKVLDQDGNGLDSTIIAAIEMATNPDGDPSTHDGAKIINMSLGGSGDPDDPLSQASDNAMAGGTLVVVAAGNSGPEFGTVGSPGCARQVLTVGASDKSDRMAPFSSRGPAPISWQIKPDVIAPGVSITSTVPTGSCQHCDPSGYLALSGTSMATPHVAGVAALVLERYPTWTPAEVKAAIMQRAIDFSYGAFLQGAGRLDAWNAITPLARVDVPAFSPGLDDPGQPTWTRSQVFTLANLSGSLRSYALSVLGSFPPGLSATVSPNNVTIPGNQTQSFTLTLTANNASVPNLPAEPFAYEGSVRAVSSGETLHVPFAFLKAPALTLTFDQAPRIVMVTDNATWWKYYSYPPSSFSLLTPNVTFDVVTMFTDSVSYVFHEGLHLTSNAQVSVARTEAVFPFTIVPVDSTGAPLALTTSMSLAHVGPKSRYFEFYTNSDFGGNPGSPTTFWLSAMSNHYDFDVMVLQEPGGSAATYTYLGHASNGISGPMTFQNTPADFRHVTWGYKVNPGNTAVFPMTWISSRPYNTAAIISWGACDATPATPAPFRREVYLTPRPGDEVDSGFLRQSVYGAAPFGPCSFSNYLFDTPYVAAASPTELLAWNAFNPSPVVRTSNPIFTSGIGPYAWTGSMFNSYNALYAYGNPGPWFVSQLHDLRPYTPLPFELVQLGEVVQTGTLSGTETNQPLQLAVEPGRYTLHVPFTSWFLGSQSGRADAKLLFDTNAFDPNPPTLGSLFLENGGAFVDLLPPGGGTVRFTASDDSGAVTDARLYYKTSTGYQQVPVAGDASTGFTATIPPAGGPAPTGPVAVKLQDAAGNALTYTYCNSATAIAEVCDGFDDNCDGVIPASEADLDDDSWSSCNGDDCDDTNGWVWAAPGEVAGLRFLDHNLMEWNTTQTGSLPGTAYYNVLRSSTPQNFLTLAVCVFSFDGTEPAPGAGFYYQVRARNDCPNGLGSLGTRSDGTPRVGRSCP